jgi:hypothetical protein
MRNILGRQMRKRRRREEEKRREGKRRGGKRRGGERGREGKGGEGRQEGILSILSKTMPYKCETSSADKSKSIRLSRLSKSPKIEMSSNNTLKKRGLEQLLWAATLSS